MIGDIWSDFDKQIYVYIPGWHRIDKFKLDIHSLDDNQRWNYFKNVNYISNIA